MSSYVWGLIVGLAAGLVIALAALVGVWAERKVSARVQMRLGPQEAGPFGLLQTLADTLKLILKEDITPDQADVRIFRMAPFMVFVPCAAGLAVIPFAYGWAPLNTETSALFFIAVPALSVIGILVAGWSSRNTYASIGGIRGATQMISYELPRTLSVLSLCILAGSISAVSIHDSFRWWWIPVNAIGFLVYFIASLAELNRGPFDLPEAESELVAGYFADYSGIRWSIFMMVEYGGMIAAALFGAAAFFGGGLGIRGPIGALIYAAIAVAISVAMIWAKWTYPRMRPDQLMTLAWKVLTPMALVQLLIAGVFAVVIA
ncbi:MAG: NADH-quinone oxidoreductase subunit NuoH [Coriobacteriia bacterium]|nr:NADH-quinone oxidoreductase subunit NuoH [Coriobacteriia bacterium]